MALLVILAGGKSSRFGKEKCTFTHGGKRMIEYVIEAGLGVVEDVYIAAGQNAHLYDRWRVLEDSPRFSGPLAGVDAAVSRFDRDLLFAPCDVPYIKPRVFEILLTVDTPASVWVFPNGRVESTIFKIKPKFIKNILDFLSVYKRSRIDDIFRLITTYFLSMEEHRVEPQWFVNINREEDFGRVYNTSPKVFSNDRLITWEEPPLARWLVKKEVEALEREFFKYVDFGLFSLAAHVAKDMSHTAPNFRVLADLIYSLVSIEKS